MAGCMKKLGKRRLVLHSIDKLPRPFVVATAYSTIYACKLVLAHSLQQRLRFVHWDPRVHSTPPISLQLPVQRTIESKSFQDFILNGGNKFQKFPWLMLFCVLLAVVCSWCRCWCNTNNLGFQSLFFKCFLGNCLGQRKFPGILIQKLRFSEFET